MIRTTFKLGVMTVSGCSCRKATRRRSFVSSTILLSSVSTATTIFEPDIGASSRLGSAPGALIKLRLAAETSVQNWSNPMRRRRSGHLAVTALANCLCRKGKKDIHDGNAKNKSGENRSEIGDGAPSNARLCRDCNIDKSDKLPPQ